jgi:hypothetical protein
LIVRAVGSFSESPEARRLTVLRPNPDFFISHSCEIPFESSQRPSFDLGLPANNPNILITCPFLFCIISYCQQLRSLKQYLFKFGESFYEVWVNMTKLSEYTFIKAANKVDNAVNVITEIYFLHW